MHVKLVLEIKYEFIFISNCLLRGEKKNTEKINETVFNGCAVR